MPISTARVETAKAERYLAQLCKHFAHKVPVKWDAGHGDVSFPLGACRLRAGGDALVIVCESEDEAGLARMQAVVEDHLVRFAWREALSVTWTRETEETGGGR